MSKTNSVFGKYIAYIFGKQEVRNAIAAAEQIRKPKRCIRITGTSTGELRARVERTRTPDRFEVTIGDEQWETLDAELKEAILLRAHRYVQNLDKQVMAALVELDPARWGNPFFPRTK